MSSDELYDVMDEVEDADYIASGSESDMRDTDEEDEEVIGEIADEIVVDSEDDVPLSASIATNIIQKGIVAWGIHHISSVKTPSDFQSKCGLSNEVEGISNSDSTPYNLLNLLITDLIVFKDIREGKQAMISMSRNLQTRLSSSHPRFFEKSDKQTSEEDAPGVSRQFRAGNPVFAGNYGKGLQLESSFHSNISGSSIL
ncbi:hypothetical protein JTB14_007308 [Gonioctena quinquepunctata]|nr:hypothetical protein JTB14_007308 [Gonioctena quinquepunctata]